MEGYILKERTELKGSSLAATAELKGGMWHVEFTRPLAASMKGEKTFDPGKTYTFGIALHDQYTTGRFHLVSFEYTMSQTPGADLLIKKR